MNMGSTTKKNFSSFFTPFFLLFRRFRLIGSCVFFVLLFLNCASEASSESTISLIKSPQFQLPVPKYLPTCCDYQNQFTISQSPSSSCKPNLNNELMLVEYQNTLELPSQIFTSKGFGDEFEGHLSNGSHSHGSGSLKYRLQKDKPNCPDGTFEIVLNFDGSNGKDLYNLVAFTRDGYLQMGLDYYSPNEYCINSINSDKMTFAVCKPTCDEAHPCIPKCCDIDEAFDFGDPSGPYCGPAVRSWKPVFYEDRYNKLSREKSSEIQPHYVLNHPGLGFCEYGHPFLISLKSIQDGMTGILFRILQDGSVITRVRRRQWNYLNKGDYCLDGSKNLFHTKFTSPNAKEEEDDETIIFYCHKEVATNEATISKLYGASMIISSMFLLVTLIVFGLLWEKHKYNIQRWTIFAYVLTLLLMYFFFILSYFSNFFDGEVATNMGMCRFVGIGMHFFFLSTFCWLTTLNFEIWWTVKSFTSQSKYLTGFRRLFAYGIFAFGIPVVILSVGLILESIYESDINSEVIVPEYGKLTCNLGSRDAFWAYMYGPVGFLLICNTVFFITTIVQMWKILNNPKTQSSVTPVQRKQSELVSRFGKLYIVMGVPWIFEVISFAAHEDEFRWYWIIFDLINIFQSVAIFIIFVCNQETVVGIQTKYPFLKNILSPLISKKTSMTHLDGVSVRSRNNPEEEDEDSGKLSTVDFGTVVPKETMEMT